MALAGWLRERPWASGEDATDAWPPSRPANDVHGAWVSMVERADVDRPRTRTPGECARAAVDAGLEDEAVATITQLFVEVKYAGQALTDDRQQRARQWAERLIDGAARPRRGDRGSGGDASGRKSRRGRLPGVGRLLGFELWAGRWGEE